MKLQSKFSFVMVTSAVAFGCGHFVQQTAALRAEQVLPQPLVMSDVQAVASGPRRPLPDYLLLQPAQAFAAELTQVDLIADLQAADIPENCTLQLGLLPLPNAMVGLSLLAPCHSGERVVLSHAGLAVTAKTSASGGLITQIPALTPVAEVRVVFASGQQASALVDLPDFGTIERFAVQWQDADAFQLHAFENGAEFGEAGHRWSDSPGKAGQNGYVTLLGDATTPLPLLAQIYTFSPSLDADVVVEAEVTSTTCARALLGETLLSRRGKVEVSDLTLEMPDCGALGDFLVLKNLVQDMTLAANH